MDAERVSGKGPSRARIAVMAAAMSAAVLAASASNAAPATSDPEIKIGMLDTVVYRVPFRDKNMSVASKDMTGGKAARWDGESGCTHGELVAASAVKAARVQNPNAHISIYAANIYTPSDADVGRSMRGPKSDPDASKVHLTLDYGAADKALSWFKEQGVSVVVMTGTGQDSPRMRALADKVRDSGMVMVASTNNANVHGKVFPAAYPDVISVAGSDKSLPVSTSAELASYVSYVGDARVPLRDGRPEIGSSFAAGAIGGVLAARAADSGEMSLQSARQWLDAVSVKARFSGYDIGVVASDIRHDPSLVPLRTTVVAQQSAPEAPRIQPQPQIRQAAYAAMAAGSSR